MGKNRSTITNYLRLLKLPPQIQKAIMDRVISMGHARALINIDDEVQQLQLFKDIIKNQLSVRAVEEASRKTRTAKQPSARKELPIEYERIRNSVSDQIAAKVDIKANAKGKGSLVINFNDEDDLRRVLNILDLWP